MPRTSFPRSILRFVALPLVAAGSMEASAQAPQDASPDRPMPLFEAPGGETIATLAPGAAPFVVREEGDWIRVRVEGWLRRDDAAGVVTLRTEGIVTLAALRDEPERFEGATVRWRVQFVSTQVADHLRSDMTPGEQYLLVRDPGGEPGFAYVVVPDAAIPWIANLAPLQRVEITATVRSGRSPLTGHPILDLLELET